MNKISRISSHCSPLLSLLFLLFLTTLISCNKEPEDAPDLNVSVYPNPCENFVAIQVLKTDAPDASLSVFDTKGDELQSSPNVDAGFSIVVDLQDKPKGYYTVVLQDGSKLSTIKIAKF